MEFHQSHSTNDFDDSPYPYDPPKFRLVVKRCIMGLI